jgi:hypothetical protein
MVSRLRKSSTSSSLQARTYPENERAMTSPPALEVASKCGNCGTGATTSLSLATGQALRLRGSRLELRPRRSIAPGPIPIYVYGLILLAPLCTFIHRSAWKGNSPKFNFRFTAFSEVQHSPVPLPGALGTERRVFSPKYNLMFVERTSMIAHIYPSVLQAVSGRGYAGCLERVFSGASERDYAGSWI